MSVTVSKRKKYVRPMTATWWQKLDFYKAYMLREATSIFAVMVLYCIALWCSLPRKQSNARLRHLELY